MYLIFFTLSVQRKIQNAKQKFSSQNVLQSAVEIMRGKQFLVTFCTLRAFKHL